jgi:hypothetical protein
MNTVFLSWCRALKSKRGVLVLAEMLCLIAVASAFLVVTPLVQANNHGYGDKEADAEEDEEAAVAEKDKDVEKKKEKKKNATFKSIVTTISKEPSGSGDIVGTTAKLFSHITLDDLKNDPWVIVTLKIRSKTVTFGATAFLDPDNRKPSVWLAEVLPPNNPNDPILKPFIGKTLPLIGLK